MSRYDRSPEAQAWRALYNSAEWKRLRLDQLTDHPLCAFCLAKGRITPATVADHVRPHRGDRALFFDPNNLQSLCDAPGLRCHSSRKQAIETRGYSDDVGVDGLPIDLLHPFNA